MNFKIQLVLIFLTLSATLVRANIADSLEQLSSQLEGMEKVEVLIELSAIYESNGNFVDLAKLYNKIGSYFKDLEDLDNALDYYSKSYELSIESGFEVFVSDTAFFNDLIPSLRDDLFYDPHQASVNIRKAINLARALGLEHHKAQLLISAGVSYDLRGLYDSAFMAFDKGLEIVERNGFTKLMGELYNNYSITLAVVGRMEKSIDYAFKARDIFEEIGDSLLISRVYNNLGSRYSEIKYTDLALEYYLKAAEINQKLKHNRRLAYNYGNIGLLYSGLHQYEMALDYFYKSLELLDTIHNPYDYSLALHNLAKAHLGLNNVDIAREYEERALAISLEVNDELGILVSTVGMAEIYLKTGDLKTAMQLLEESEPIALKLGTPFYLMRVYDNKVTILAKRKDYENAFKYTQKYLVIKDSIMITERDKAIDIIKDFEQGRQQREIASLKQENELKKLRLFYNRIIMYSLGLLSSTIIIITLLLIQRTKIRSISKNAELEQKLFRSQMNPHFIFNALNAIQSFIYKNEPNEAGRYLSNFARLIRLILINSRQEYISIENETKTLTYYLELQRLRFNNKFDYTLTVDPAINTEFIFIPPMLAQPFIENSIEHGIQHLTKKGTINISFKLVDASILFLVEDNGVGLNNSNNHKSEGLSKHESLALSITEERLKLLNKKTPTKISLEIKELVSENKDAIGTLVSFNIPFCTINDIKNNNG